MAKEPQQGLPMSDDLRKKVKIAFRGAQKRLGNNPDILESYLLLGYAYGLLLEYDLIPTIRDAIGPGWVSFYNELWKKVVDPRGLWLDIILPDDSFIRIPYSVLIHEFALGTDLFKLFGLQHGKQLSDFNNLSEANSYYSNPAFEKLVNDFLVRRDLERQELYAIREEIHMEDCSEECSYEEPAPVPIIPESTPAYMPGPTCGPTSGCASMPQQPCAPQSGCVPASAPEPVLVDKVPKEKVVMTEKQIPEYQRKKGRKEIYEARERRRKEEEKRKRKEKELPIKKEMKEEIKRLEKKVKERAEKDESEEKQNEDKPIEINPIKEKEINPKESTKVIDELEQESESEMEPESDFEESFEKKPLGAMDKRTKRLNKEKERKEKQKQDLKPREPPHKREINRHRDLKKATKEEIYPEFKKMQEKIKSGDTNDMEKIEVESKPERKNRIIMNDEMKMKIVENYKKLLDILFEQNHASLKEYRFHEPYAVYNRVGEYNCNPEEEKQRIFNNPNFLKDEKPEKTRMYNGKSPFEHYIYLGDDWWYNASLSENEIKILDSLNIFGTEDRCQRFLKILKENNLEDYLKKLGTPLERELTIEDINPFKVNDRDRNFFWNNTNRDIVVENNAIYIRIPDIKRGDYYLFYRIISNLPTKPLQ